MSVVVQPTLKQVPRASAPAPAHRTQPPAHRASAGMRLRRFRPVAWAVAGTTLLTIVVLTLALGSWGMLIGLVLALVGGTVGRRRSAVNAWQRELEKAFRLHEREDLNFRRVL